MHIYNYGLFATVGEGDGVGSPDAVPVGLLPLAEVGSFVSVVRGVVETVRGGNVRDKERKCCGLFRKDLGLGIRVFQRTRDT